MVLHMHRAAKGNCFFDGSYFYPSFNYRAVRSWTYTVKYLLEGTETPVPGSTVETGTTSDQNVMITFKTFEGYTLKSDPVQKVTKEASEVIFYYVPKTAIYHIQHWYERLDGDFGLRYIETYNTAGTACYNRRRRYTS